MLFEVRHTSRQIQVLRDETYNARVESLDFEKRHIVDASSLLMLKQKWLPHPHFSLADQQVSIARLTPSRIKMPTPVKDSYHGRSRTRQSARLNTLPNHQHPPLLPLSPRTSATPPPAPESPITAVMAAIRLAALTHAGTEKENILHALAAAYEVAEPIHNDGKASNNVRAPNCCKTHIMAVLLDEAQRAVREELRRG